MFLGQSFQLHGSILHSKKSFLEKINISFITLAIWPEGSWFLMKEQIFTTLLWMSWALLCQHCTRRQWQEATSDTSWVTLGKSLNQLPFLDPSSPQTKGNSDVFPCPNSGGWTRWFFNISCRSRIYGSVIRHPSMLKAPFFLLSAESAFLGDPDPSHNKSWMWVNHNLTT